MFKQAVLKLTWQYTLLLLGLAAFLSGGIYLYMELTFATDYRHSITNQLQLQDADHGPSRSHDIDTAVDAGLDRLRDGILLADGLLVIIIPGISYLMAKRALAPIESAYEVQQRFVDDASHELRTPLSIIQGELELSLQRPRSTGEYQEAIGNSLGETRALSGLVSNLLLLARGQREDISAAFERVNLETCAKRAIASAAATSVLSKRVSLHSAKESYVTGSVDLLERAIANLIDNALKYSDSNARVEVSIRSNVNQLRLSVTDHGIGMSELDSGQATSRFWRAEQSRSTPGHGLGLAIVHQIMELHGGTFQIESVLGKGTIATLSFERVV